jgi:NAD(P)H-dependent flavin oxidoreductase YrpB (nitropropane dioxygenase family)
MPNQLCRDLKISFPLMAFTRGPDAVAEVSLAGGIGVQAAIGFSPDDLKRALDRIATRLDGQPWGLDVVMPSGFSTPDGDKTSGGGMAAASDYRKMLPKEHIEFLDNLLVQYGVPALPPGTTVQNAMAEWTDAVSRKQVAIGLEYGPAVIANALGTPPADVVEECHRRGVKVAALVGTAEHARRHVAGGVDIVVAQGTEAGGHTGEIASMVLVPEVVDAIGATPVVAAGGIACGRQVVAALALGAQAVWTGSMWLTTFEGQIDAAVTSKLIKAGSSDTIRSKAITGKYARQLRTKWTDAWENPANPNPLPMPMQFLLTAEAVERIHRHAKETGNVDLVAAPIGQIVGRLNELRPAAEVIAEMKREYYATLAALRSIV